MAQKFLRICLGKPNNLSNWEISMARPRKTSHKHLDLHRRPANDLVCPAIVIGVDCSFFGRGYGIILARCPGLKRTFTGKKLLLRAKRRMRKPDDFWKRGLNIQQW